MNLSSRTKHVKTIGRNFARQPVSPTGLLQRTRYARPRTSVLSPDPAAQIRMGSHGDLPRESHQRHGGDDRRRDAQVLDCWAELPPEMQEAIDQFRIRLGAAIDSVYLVKRALDQEVHESEMRLG
jgi:hypothetical protein